MFSFLTKSIFAPCFLSSRTKPTVGYKKRAFRLFSFFEKCDMLYLLYPLLEKHKQCNLRFGHCPSFSEGRLVEHDEYEIMSFLINQSRSSVVHIANVITGFVRRTLFLPSEMFNPQPQSEGLVKHPSVTIYSVITEFPPRSIGKTDLQGSLRLINQAFTSLV